MSAAGRARLRLLWRSRCPAEVWATDISLAALSVAAANARRLGADVRFVACRSCSVRSRHVSFDVVVSNPPYVGLHEADGLQREVRDYEPHVALFRWRDRDRNLRALDWRSPRRAAAGRMAAVRTGLAIARTRRGMLTAGWSDFEVIGDLAGIPRVLAARWTP